VSSSVPNLAYASRNAAMADRTENIDDVKVTDR
jgi:hypothetical protein